VSPSRTASPGCDAHQGIGGLTVLVTFSLNRCQFFGVRCTWISVTKLVDGPSLRRQWFTSESTGRSIAAIEFVS
jgi:hypothetical protein